MPLRHLLVLSLIPAFFGVAQAEVIDPIGDENLGYIHVTAPANAPSDPRDVELDLSKDSSNRGVTIKLGKVERVLKGNKCLGLASSNFSHKTCGLQIKAKETTTLTIGHLEAYINKELMEIGFGNYPQLTIQRRLDNEVLWQKSSDFKNFVLPDDLILSVVLPTSKANYGFERVEKVLGQGELFTTNLSPTKEPRAKLSYEMEQQPAFPDVANPCPLPAKVFLLDRDPKYRDRAARSGMYIPHPDDFSNKAKDMEKWDKLPIRYSQKTGIRQYRKFDGQELLYYPKRSTEAQYELVLNNIPVAFHIRPGMSKVIKMGRLDVNDVLITREDGSTFRQPGKYRLFFRAQEDKPWQPLRLARYRGTAGRCSRSIAYDENFDTKTGLDVPPLMYRIQVDYKTREGSAKYTTEVDLRTNAPNTHDGLITPENI